MTTPAVESLLSQDPRDLDIQTIDRLRILLLNDLYLFAWAVFGYRDLQLGLHDRICRLLTDWGQPDLRRLLIQIPRESFKTSLCTIANSTWQVFRGFYTGHDDAVVIFNARLENSQKWLRAIRDVVQSSRLIHTVFKDILPPGVASSDSRSLPRWWKWSDTELLFHRTKAGIPEASITASGLEAATTGGHWPTIIVDDPIELRHQQSPAEMQRAREWIDRHVYLMKPAELGRCLVVDTPWTYTDINVDLVRRYGYKLYRRHALEDPDGFPDIANGQSIMPKKLSTDALRKMYDRDNFGFNSQMMCMPRPGKEQSFDPAWVRECVVHDFEGQQPSLEILPQHYDPTLGSLGYPSDINPPRLLTLATLSKTLLWDPAPSKESDRKRHPLARNGLVMEAMDDWGRRFVLEAQAIRSDPLSVIHEAFSMLDRWGANRIGIEKVNFSSLYEPFMRFVGRSDSRYRDRQVSFIPLEPGRQDKDTRITSRIPILSSGLYYFNRPLCRPLLQEMLEYPNGETVDLLDALAYDDCLTRPAGTLSLQYHTSHTDSYQSTTDPITGY